MSLKYYISHQIYPELRYFVYQYLGGWTLIKKYLNNIFVKRSYYYLVLVPLLVKALNEVKSPLNFIIFGEKITIVFELPFNLLMFYIASILFSLGLILFYLGAPNIIKENNSLADFLSESKDNSHIVGYIYNFGNDTKNMSFFNKFLDQDDIIIFGILINNINSEKIPYILEIKPDEMNLEDCGNLYYYLTGFLSFHNVDLFKTRMNLYLFKDLLNSPLSSKIYNLDESFWFLFNYAKTKNIIYLILALLSFFIGFIFIGIVIIQSIITVFQYLM